MRRSYFLIFCYLAFAAAPAFAAASEQLAPTPFGGASDDQIEVTADDSLEWHQNGRFYLAKGNAKATRGTMTVEADTLMAYEREKGSNETKAPGGTPAGGNINRLTAEGHVRLSDARQQVFGDHAEYDLDARLAKITGKNLKYVTDKDVVTARDSLEYHEGQNIAVARGKAVAVHDQRRIEADVMTAHFTQGPKGQMDMTDMTAEGHVTVITAGDISRGDKAVYDMKRNIAMMTGHVRVTRGETQLSGERAEVDFNKGESRLLSGGKTGRVRALLVPKSDDTPQTINQTQNR